MTCLKIKANVNKNIKIIRLVYEVIIEPAFEVENVVQDVDNVGGGGGDDNDDSRNDVALTQKKINIFIYL